LAKEKWRQAVADVVPRLSPALRLDDVVLGGGNARNLEESPEGSRAGDNASAFAGGFLL
jgi:polyphosphate glucokinase